MVTHDPYTRPPQSAFTITVLGGTGFLGRHLVHRLTAHGHRVNVLTRNREAHREMLVDPSVEVFTADPYDPETLARFLDRSEVAINLVGILNEKEHDGSGFQRAHVELTKLLADTARKTGVRRFLQMSALGADIESRSHYQRTKAEAEKYLLKECAGELDVTVFRPSLIFGPGENFVTRFAGLLRMAPGILPLARAETRFAPVYVMDVVEAFARSLYNPHTFGKVYELCGPDVYTLADLVRYVRRHAGIRRGILPLPQAVAKLQATVMEYLPGKPFSLDNFHSMQKDNVCHGNNGLLELGIRPTGMDAYVPFQLGSRPLPRVSYSRYRRDRRDVL